MCRPTPVLRARRGVHARAIRRRAPPFADIVADAVLVVSELVTNSVQAGCDVCEIEVSVSLSRVDIAVRDDAGGWPTVQAPGTDALSGRGLLLVSALTRSWTVGPWAQGGKQVSAVLSLQTAPGSASPDGTAQ